MIELLLLLFVLVTIGIIVRSNTKPTTPQNYYSKEAFIKLFEHAKLNAKSQDRSDAFAIAQEFIKETQKNELDYFEAGGAAYAMDSAQANKTETSDDGIYRQEKKHVQHVQSSNSPIDFDKMLHNANTFLYMGAFLIVVAVGTFISYNFDALTGVTKTLIILGFTAAFYSVGIYLVKTNKKLFSAGMTFTIIGMLIAPLVGLSVQQFILPYNVYEIWVATSLLCSVLYVATYVLYKNLGFAYSMGLAFGSLLLSIFYAVHLPEIFTASVLVIIALVYTIFTHNYKKDIVLEQSFDKLSYVYMLSALFYTLSHLFINFEWSRIAPFLVTTIAYACTKYKYEQNTQTKYAYFATIVGLIPLLVVSLLNMSRLYNPQLIATYSIMLTLIYCYSTTSKYLSALEKRTLLGASACIVGLSTLLVLFNYSILALLALTFTGICIYAYILQGRPIYKLLCFVGQVFVVIWASNIIKGPNMLLISVAGYITLSVIWFMLARITKDNLTHIKTMSRYCISPLLMVAALTSLLIVPQSYTIYALNAIIITSAMYMVYDKKLEYAATIIMSLFLITLYLPSAFKVSYHMSSIISVLSAYIAFSLYYYLAFYKYKISYIITLLQYTSGAFLVASILYGLAEEQTFIHPYIAYYLFFSSILAYVYYYVKNNKTFLLLSLSLVAIASNILCWHYNVETKLFYYLPWSLSCLYVAYKTIAKEVSDSWVAAAFLITLVPLHIHNVFSAGFHYIITLFTISVVAITAGNMLRIARLLHIGTVSFIIALNVLMQKYYIDNSLAYTLPWALYAAYYSYNYHKREKYAERDTNAYISMVLVTVPLALQALSSPASMYAFILLGFGLLFLLLGTFISITTMQRYGIGTIIAVVVYIAKDFVFTIPSWAWYGIIGIGLLYGAVQILNKRKD
jgi:hypothetical protein